MARRPGQAFPVDDDWRRRVESRLKELGWTRADLAHAAGVKKSTITDLLNGKLHGCMDLPKIHRALDWRWAPSLPLVSHDAGELLGLWDMFDDVERGRVLERARTIYEEKLRREGLPGGRRRN